MKTTAVLPVFCLLLTGCGHEGFPTAPTNTVTVTPPPVVVSAPPVVTPPPIVTPPSVLFPPNDPRFNLTFYRQFVHDYSDVLRRQSESPRIYLRTIDDAGAAIDTFTLNETARALETTAGSLTGVFGLRGIERGTETRLGQPGWITVLWSAFPNERDANYSYCGQAAVGGGVVTLFPKSRFCRCGGGPAVVLSIVKHELGHALGFRHTDNRDDLMYPTYSACDQTPSAREVYHASVAYTRPIGSMAP